MALKIVFLDGFTINPGDLNWKTLEACGDLTVYDRTSPADVVRRIADAEVVIVNKTVLSEEHFSVLPKLRLICVAATGFDRVDVASARKHGITVCNCAGYSSRSVAQLVASFILEVADSVGEYARLNRDGAWNRSEDFCYTIRPRIELVGKRMAIVGFGHIGRAVADVMRPFGLKLFAVSSKGQEGLPEDVSKISLEEAFATCDIVSLNCPLTENNAKMVNAGLLDKAKPGLLLVNTARGGLVDEADVCEALVSHKLGAYLADVLAQEPPTASCPLLKAPRVYLTPHIGWATPDARMRILSILSENIRAFMAGTPQNVVN